jgi:hypothetical protein
LKAKEYEAGGVRVFILPLILVFLSFFQLKFQRQKTKQIQSKMRKYCMDNAQITGKMKLFPLVIAALL